MSREGDPQPERRQQFYISYSKYLFLKNDLVVVAEEPLPLDEARSAGLVPLIMYGITIERLPIRWLKFSRASEPEDLISVLNEGWASAPGLRGRPDVVVVSRMLFDAAPELGSALRSLGVLLEVAGPGDKSTPAALSAAHKSSQSMMYHPKGDAVRLADPLARVNAAGQYEHMDRLKHAHIFHADKADLIERWMQNQINENADGALDSIAWTQGEWMGSWQQLAEKNTYRGFDKPKNGVVWMIKVSDPVSDRYLQEKQEIVDNLISCWPNDPKDIAAAAGITKLKLSWYRTRKRPLHYDEEAKLLELLGVEKFADDRPDFSPCVLIARVSTHARNVYEDMSGGGDAEPYEITPASGVIDPSWQYILLNGYSWMPVFFMVQRGSTTSANLEKTFMNFGGTKAVPESIYKDIVSTCAQACMAVEANLPTVTAFASRQKQWLTRMEDLRNEVYKY